MSPAEATLAELEDRIGHSFGDRGLLERALVHSSAGAETGAADNETLEFLGDTVIDLAVSSNLMHVHPDYDEGQLSRLRAAVVSESALADAAGTIELGRWLRLGRGEENSGGRHKPSILAGSFEAVVGAVFLDAGYDVAQTVVVQHLERLWEIARTLETDFKTRLQELTQERFRVVPSYETIDVSGPDHRRHYHAVVEVNGKRLGAGEGPSRKRAEQMAAFEALDRLTDK